MSEIKPGPQTLNKHRMIRNATWGAILLTSAALLFLVVGFVIAEITSWQDYFLLGAPAALFVLGLISIALLRREKIVLGTSLIFIANLIMPIVGSLLQTEIGWAVFVYTLISSSLLIWLTLPQASHRWAMIITGITLVFITSIELLDPAIRISPADELSVFIIAVTAILFVAFIALALQQAWTGNIRARLIASFLALVIIPLLVSGGISILIFRQAAITDINDRLNSSASLKEASINFWLTNMQDSLAIVFHAHEETDLVHTMTNPDKQGESGHEEHITEILFADITEDLRSILEKAGSFEEIFVLDSNGQVLISTNGDQVGKVFTNQDFFTEGLLDYYVQAPQYSQSLEKITVVVSKPLTNEHGDVGGVLAGRANLDVLDEVMLANIGVGETGETYLVRSNHALLTPSIFEGYPEGDTYVRTEGANTAISNKQDGTRTYPGYQGSNVMGAYRWLPNLQVALMAEVDESEALSTATTSTITNISVVVGAAVVAFVVALFITRTIANPLSDLADAAKLISKGNLDIAVGSERQDEIGTLAISFNDMAAQLKETLGSLEQQVKDRTHALETSTEVGRRLSTILNQDELVQEVVDQVQEAFEYYHAQIYLFDEDKDFLIMVGGTGKAGQTMLEEGHSVPKGRGLVGRAGNTNLPIWVSDVTQADGWLPNPLLPETRSEAALPIAAGQNVLGVLDVQDDEVGSLTEIDVDLLQSIANQVASALQNARAYQRTQEQVARESLMTSINQQIQSTTDVESALQVAVRELGQALGMDASVKLNQGRN